MSLSQAYKSWMGYAFELLVYKHIIGVKKKLGITGIYSEISNFYENIDDKGAVQIDLIIQQK